MTLSEALPSIQDMLQEAYSDLAAVRHRLRGEELPDQLDIDESELERPAVRAQIEKPHRPLGQQGSQRGLTL